MRKKVNNTEIAKKVILEQHDWLSTVYYKNRTMQSLVKPKEQLAIMEKNKKTKYKIQCDCPTIKICSCKKQN